MSGIGHNSGRSLQPGTAWRRHVWRKARAQLLPKLPVEVVRLRVRRAKELGLPYKTYAGIRASSGHDLIGFLFSSNALRVFKAAQDMPNDRTTKLGELIDTRQIGLIHVPCNPAHFVPPLHVAYRAPTLTDGWSGTRDAFVKIMRPEGPRDRFVLVGDTELEREWATAAQTAGYLSAQDYFT